MCNDLGENLDGEVMLFPIGTKEFRIKKTLEVLVRMDGVTDVSSFLTNEGRTAVSIQFSAGRRGDRARLRLVSGNIS